MGIEIQKTPTKALHLKKVLVYSIEKNLNKSEENHVGLMHFTLDPGK